MYELFEKNIKDLETERFSDTSSNQFSTFLDNHEQPPPHKGTFIVNESSISECTNLLDQSWKMESWIEMSFLSDMSYEPIATGPAPKIERPNVVPALNFDKMQENLIKIWETEVRQAQIKKAFLD